MWLEGEGLETEASSTLHPVTIPGRAVEPSGLCASVERPQLWDGWSSVSVPVSGLGLATAWVCR